MMDHKDGTDGCAADVAWLVAGERGEGQQAGDAGTCGGQSGPALAGPQLRCGARHLVVTGRE
jgi:hypothetical protein